MCMLSCTVLANTARDRHLRGWCQRDKEAGSSLVGSLSYETWCNTVVTHLGFSAGKLFKNATTKLSILFKCKTEKVHPLLVSILEVLIDF